MIRCLIFDFLARWGFLHRLEVRMALFEISGEDHVEGTDYAAVVTPENGAKKEFANLRPLNRFERWFVKPSIEPRRKKANITKSRTGPHWAEYRKMLEKNDAQQ